MQKDCKDKVLTSTERRRFLKLSAGFGITAALVALSRNALGSEEAADQIGRKETELEAAAEHTMILGTAYAPGVSRSYPIMQLDFKENIQNASLGKIYVQLEPSGQVGSGGALARNVQNAIIQAGQCSISNFSPFVPEVDLINLPYWCSENQKFVNLVTSDTWKKKIHPKIEARGFKPLWYPCIDPRTLAMGQGVKEKITTPEQMRGIKFRIPNSTILQRLYRQLGAHPILVEWVEAANAIRLGSVRCPGPVHRRALCVRIQKSPLSNYLCRYYSGCPNVFLQSGVVQPATAAAEGIDRFCQRNDHAAKSCQSAGGAGPRRDANDFGRRQVKSVEFG